MPVFSVPSLALPAPLRAVEVPSFTNHSVVTRLPEIGRRVLAENHFTPDVTARIQTLIDEIPYGPIRSLNLPTNNGTAGWEAYTRPYLGMNWLEAPWFFAEEYFYVRILEAIAYFERGPNTPTDPYAAQKRLGLDSSRDAIRTLMEQVSTAETFTHTPEGSAAFRDGLTRLLLVDLGGNQNDLSMWPVRQDASGKAHIGGSSASTVNTLDSAREHILADDTNTLLEYMDQLTLRQRGAARVDIILDNAGYELVTDLALADFLITSGRVEQVVLHAKSYPVFVSDALERDIHSTLDYLLHDNNRASRAMAIRLRGCLMNDRLRLRHHPFWTSPLPLWEAPADLADDLRDSDLLISKGDANYRRLLGDRHWPIDLTFASVVDYLPVGLLALRMLKSEIAVGIPSEVIPTSDPDWMVNGRWGMVQFAAPRIRL